MFANMNYIVDVASSIFIFLYAILLIAVIIYFGCNAISIESEEVVSYEDADYEECRKCNLRIVNPKSHKDTPSQGK